MSTRWVPRVSQLAGGRVLLAVLFSMFCAIGCEPPPSSSIDKAVEGGKTVADGDSAREILDAVADTYAKAKTYEDVGELYVEAEENGKKQTFPPNEYTVSFERPNRLRAHAFGASVVSDGELLRATVPRIEQILTLPSPPKLEMSHLLNDKLVAESFSRGLPVLPALRLLLGDKELPGFGSDAKLTRLDDAKLDNESCARVEATTEEGKTVYWVDPKTHLLKRIDFATAGMLKQQQDEVDGLKIWIDFKNARIDDKIADKAFEFEAPPNAQLVKRLLAPPPQPPPALLGQEIGEFAFDDLQDSGTIDRAALNGKVAVFDFWATWCGWCFRGLPNVQKVYEKFKDNDKVAIYAVDTDESNVTDEAVKKSFSDAKLELPIARDRKESNKEVFEVQGLPTMVVLDGKGTVQYVHVGFDPNVEKELTGVIDRLLKGEDVAREALEKHEEDRRKYEQELNEVLIGTTSTLEVPQSKIAERSEPSKLKLEPLWTAEEVALPGNVLVLGEPNEEPTIYVLSGSRKIIQVGTKGEVIERHELDIPRELGVSWLRTAADARGERYFAAFASTQQQLFLFDKSWQRLLAYPDSKHAGLSDVQLADLDGDGQPEILAGYWGVVGVQAVSLEGERKWSNRLENVTRLAISDPEKDGRRRVLCVNGRDFIMPIDHDGKSQSEIRVPGQSLYALFTADLEGGPPAEMCALNAGEVGALTAIGLDEKGETLWSYPLPRGIHNQPVELVTAGKVPTSGGDTQGVWLLIGPDGSIHILAADGQLIDKFNYGEELTGIATATLEGQHALIVASTKSLTAWTVEAAN